jgi:hypothetical protein
VTQAITEAGAAAGPVSASDIRRRLPDYVERFGEAVYHAPYRATRADLHVFLFRADRAALDALVARTLDAPLRSGAPGKLGGMRGLGFGADGAWLAMIFALMRSLSSDDPADAERGSLAAYELSVWLPLAKVVEGVDGRSQQPAWHLPYVFTAPVASVMTGREVYGYPKWPAYIELPEAPGDGRYRASYRRGFTAEVATGRLRPLEDGAVELGPWPWAKVGTASAGGRRDREGDARLVGEYLRRMVDNTPLVFLKQFPGVDGAAGAPCYQAIVEARVPITGGRGFREPTFDPELRLDLPPRVAHDLGLAPDARPVAHLSLEGASFEVQRGDELWVAAGHAGGAGGAPAPQPVRRGLEPAPVPDDVDADVRLVVVPADAARLAALVRAELQRPLAFPPGPHVGVAGTTPPTVHGGPGWVALAFVHRRGPGGATGPDAGSSDADRPDADGPDAGSPDAEADGRATRAWELIVLVPVEATGAAAGGAVPAWYVPMAVASPGSTVLYAREAIGLPYQEGFLTIPTTPAGRHAVALSTPVATSPTIGPMTVVWRKTDVFEVDLPPAVAAGPAAVPVGPPAGAERWLGGAPAVFGLKQFRHVAATGRACHQSLVRTELDVGRPIGRWDRLADGATLRVRNYVPLARSLGLMADELPVLAAYAASGVPFRFGATTELWAART